MTEIPRRTLGRTGLEVTTLGYGAMELRGAPTGPDLSADDAAALLNERARRGHQLHRHVDRLRTQRGR